LENKLKLSIIIPVYNLEGYIAQTLESCLKQNLPCDEYEIICVNDGSKDGSISILREYNNKFPNVKIFDIPNGGVSHARNIGICYARGKYIWFVDGDDLVAENCLRGILDFLEKNLLDKLVMQVKNFHDGFLPESPDSTFQGKYDIQISNCQSDTYHFYNTYGGGGVWKSIYRAAIVSDNKIKFSETITYSEDILFDFIYNLYAKKVAKTDFIGYFYRQRKTSAIHNSNNDKFISSMGSLIEEYSLLSAIVNEDLSIVLAEKINLAMKSLLFGIFLSGNTVCAENYLRLLKSKHIYPYLKISHPTRGAANWKQKAICLLKNNFTNESFFILMVNVRRMAKGTSK